MNYKTARALFRTVIGYYVDIWPTVGKRLEEHGPAYELHDDRTALCRCSSKAAEVSWPCPTFADRLAEADEIYAARFQVGTA